MAIAKVELTVVRQSVDVGRLQPLPGFRLHGNVTVADAKTGDPFPSGISIQLQPKDRHSERNEDTRATVQAQGEFTIRNVLADQYWLVVSGLPNGFYLTEARSGPHDAMREPMHAGSGELRIGLKSDGASLSGRVVDDDERPVSDAVVVLATEILPTAGAPGAIRTQPVDQNGQFLLNSIAPGKYRLLAFNGLTPGEGESPDFVRGHLSRSAEVTLVPRDAKSATLKVVRAH